MTAESIVGSAIGQVYVDMGPRCCRGQGGAILGLQGQQADVPPGNLPGGNDGQPGGEGRTFRRHRR